MKTKITILLVTISDVQMFCRAAISLPCEVDIVSGRHKVDAKSLMGIYSLDLSKPIDVVFDEDYAEIAEETLARWRVNDTN